MRLLESGKGVVSTITREIRPGALQEPLEVCTSRGPWPYAPAGCISRMARWAILTSLASQCVEASLGQLSDVVAKLGQLLPPLYSALVEFPGIGTAASEASLVFQVGAVAFARASVPCASTAACLTRAAAPNLPCLIQTCVATVLAP